MNVLRKTPNVAAELVMATSSSNQLSTYQVDQLMRELSKLDRATTVHELLDMLLDYRELIELANVR